MDNTTTTTASGDTQGCQPPTSLNHAQVRAIDRVNMRTTYPDLAFLSVGDVEGLLGVTRKFLYAMEEEGRFPRRIKLGHRVVRYKMSEVVAWIEEKKAEAQVELTDVSFQEDATVLAAIDADIAEGGK